MKLALDKKDSDLAAAQKAAQDKTVLVDKKLASVGTLEGVVTRLTSCLNEANREVTSLKKDNVVLNEKLESAIRKRNDTEAYLRTLAKKLYLTPGGGLLPFLHSVRDLVQSSHQGFQVIFKRYPRPKR